MSSMLGSQGVVFATAMAVSGTVLLLTFRLQKPTDHHQLSSQNSPQILRSCIPSEKKRKSKKKRVHFAEDVVDPSGDGAEFRRQIMAAASNSSSTSSSSSSSSSSSLNFKKTSGGGGQKTYKGMPANRVALYNGMLRGRVVHHRLAYSH